MGHYDQAYDEMAEKSRRITQENQARCDHRNGWVPVLCNEQGRTTKIQCPLCHLVKQV